MLEPHDRIDALEAKVAFQEDTIASLNEALVCQQTRLDELERLLEMSLAEIKGGQEPGAGQAEPPPPHY